MSKEFERLEALFHLSEPSDWKPQVDLGEAAKLAARWSWLLRRVREQRGRAQLQAGDQSTKFGPDTPTDQS
jgi:hypothetical protein